MFVILWEFEVKPGSEEAFERVYSSSGAWAQLFRQDQHYHGTRLLRDVSRPLHFYTIDYWDSESARRDFLARYESQYHELDRSTEKLTTQERLVFSCASEQPLTP